RRLTALWPGGLRWSWPIAFPPFNAATASWYFITASCVRAERTTNCSFNVDSIAGSTSFSTAVNRLRHQICSPRSRLRKVDGPSPHSASLRCKLGYIFVFGYNDFAMPPEEPLADDLKSEMDTVVGEIFDRCVEVAPNFGVERDCLAASLEKTVKRFLYSTPDEKASPEEI